MRMASGGVTRRALFLLAVGMAVAMLTGCASPSPTASPLRLPTRIPLTSTPDRPEMARRAYQEGAALQATGDMEGAVEAFSRALALDPTLYSAAVNCARLS